MNAEEIKKRLGELSQAEGDDGVLPAVLLRLVESNEKIVERIDALKNAQKGAGESFAAMLEAVERALSAQAKKDLANLQAAQKEAGEIIRREVGNYRVCVERAERGGRIFRRNSWNPLGKILANLQAAQKEDGTNYPPRNWKLSSAR